MVHNSLITIKELAFDDAINLISAGFPFGNNELTTSRLHHFKQTFSLILRSTRLVAYHTQEKRAVGFLYLGECTPKIFSIKYVFTNPQFRKMGVASKLLNYAFYIAKKKGASKLCLDVEESDSLVIRLYQSFGFEPVGTKLVVQGYLTDSPRLRVITQTLAGKGYFEKFNFQKRGSLIPLRATSQSIKNLFFDVCQRCIDKQLIDFFELDRNNIMNGYDQTCQPLFLRDVLINDSRSFYSLIFNLPLTSYALVEAGKVKGLSIKPLMNEILKTLNLRGIGYTHLALFNVDFTEFPWLDWFKDRDFKTQKFLIMGRPV